MTDTDILIARLRHLKLTLARLVEDMRPHAAPSHWRYQ